MCRSSDWQCRGRTSNIGNESNHEKCVTVSNGFTKSVSGWLVPIGAWVAQTSIHEKCVSMLEGFTKSDTRVVSRRRTAKLIDANSQMENLDSHRRGWLRAVLRTFAR